MKSIKKVTARLFNLTSLAHVLRGVIYWHGIKLYPVFKTIGETLLNKEFATIHIPLTCSRSYKDYQQNNCTALQS